MADQPVKMKLAAPASAMGMPQAAEVATACCMGTLRQTRKGTVSEPPPMPKMVDAQPITPPAAVSAGLPGSLRAALGLSSKAIWMATQMAKTPMIFCSNGPVIADAVSAPNMQPNTIPSASQTNSGQRTAPSLWCARTELTEVKAMVAREVPTAMWVNTSGAKPCTAKL